MHRDRSWRRYRQDVIFIKRIKSRFSKSSQWWYFLNSNDDEIENPSWVDLVGCKHINFYKCDKTDKHSERVNRDVQDSYYDFRSKKHIFFYSQQVRGKFNSLFREIQIKNLLK
jgi:hypothetical protein